MIGFAQTITPKKNCSNATKVIGGISPVRRRHERDRVKHYPSVSTFSGNKSTSSGNESAFLGYEVNLFSTR